MAKKQSMFSRLCLTLLVCSFLFSCKEKKTEEQKAVVAPNYLEESREDFDQRMSWWRDAKFGMFIHWGPYSVLGGEYNGEVIDGWVGAEWIMNDAQIPVKEYEKYARRFVPSQFDADSWVKLMKNTGMKYMVITSKHHDGFALWDSKVSEYDIVDYTPYGKDILKQLSDACKKYGIKFGLYHSIMDWHHPQAQATNEPEYNSGEHDHSRYNPEFEHYYEDYLKVQLKELVDNYDPEILWFDGEWIPEYTHEHALDLYQYMRSLKPSIIMNNRIDVGRQGLMGMNKEGEDYVGDFGTPEKEMLEGTSEFDWETCMTINDTWGYRKSDHDWKSAKTLIHNLIDAAAKGGNYLLNIGPTGEGVIPAPSLERLERMGKWVAVNGASIYKTEKLQSGYKQGEHIRYAKKKGESIYYATFLEQPKSEITLQRVTPNPDSKIHLLGASEALKWKFRKDMGLTIRVPQKTLSQVGDTEAWVFVIEGKEAVTAH